MIEARRAHDRAVACYEALQRRFFRPDIGHYVDTDPGSVGGRYAYLWPFSQAMAATIDVAELADVGPRYRGQIQDRLVALDRYWNAKARPPAYDSAVRPPIGPGGDRFYDDNHWVGLDLLRLHRSGAAPAAALERAEQVFAFAISGWDADSRHPAPGGVFWVQADWNRDRGTVCNAPGAELGLLLYQITQRRSFLEWATRMYDWVERQMRAPNALYWDKIDLQGNVDQTHWSYNQGTMIGANVLFHRITGDRAYLARAEQIADTALAYYGAEGRLDAQPAIFNAILFRRLLSDELDRPAYRATIQGYADRAWEQRRDPSTDLFPFDPTKPDQFLDQAAMVQIYAGLARPTRQRPS